MRLAKTNNEVSLFIVSVFLFCLFHLNFVTASYASDSDVVAKNGVLNLSTEGASNLTSKSPHDLSFEEGMNNLSSSGQLSGPTQFALLGTCVAVGIAGAVVGGVKYWLGSYLPFQEFDWYEFSAACILGASIAITTVLLTAFPAVVGIVFGAAATDEAGLTPIVQSWIAGVLRRAVSGLSQGSMSFTALKSSYESVNSEIESSIQSPIQDLITASSGNYQEPGFDSRWIDFSTATPQSYGIAYSGVGAEYNTAYGTSWRLINPGSSQISLSFDFANAPSDATLLLTHLSSAEASCPGGGYSPVDIYINGRLLEDNYDVAENHCGSHGFNVDRWDLSGHLSTQNTVRIELEDDPFACTHYWIQNFTVLPGTPSIENKSFYFVSVFAGQNGSVSPDGLQTIPECNDVLLTATPNIGYEVDSWHMDGLVNRIGGTKFTLSQVQASHTIYVTFKAIDASYIEVVTPNGGETWFSSKSAYVTWRWEGSIGDQVKIDLYKAGSFDSQITAATNNNGNYKWDIPPGQMKGCDYQVMVSKLDDLYSDMSDNFFCIEPWQPIDTVKISTAAQLQSVSTGGAYPRDKYYVLMQDIDVSGSGIANFKPIGSDYQHYFRGTFDGQGYTISGLDIDRPTESLIGLFSVLMDNGVIKNLNIAVEGINGFSSVGALVGECAGTIVNCHVVSIDDYLDGKGGSMIGGLVGENTGTGNIRNCSVDTNPDEIEAGGSSPHGIGGIAGINSGRIEWCRTNGTIDASSSSQNIKGSEVGGIVGANYGSIVECFSECRWVQGYNKTGGIVGLQASGSIVDCYFSGADAKSTYDAGGIAGRNEGGIIDRCYVNGHVDAGSAGANEGAIVGRNSANVANSFWNRQVTGIDVCSGNGGCTNCHSKTGDEMVHEATFTTQHSTFWNFDNIWAIDEGVDSPKLRGIGDTLSRPTGFSASTDQIDSINLSWNTVTYNLAGSSRNALYSVFRSEAPSLDNQLIEMVKWQTSTSYVDTTALAEVTYYYWVRAAATPNGARESEFSDVVSGRSVYSPLNAPTAVSASDGLSLSVLVEWNEVTNANYYRVYRSPESDGTKTVLGNWVPEISYIDYPPSPETIYFYWVVAAVDTAGARASDYGGPDNGHSVKLPTDVAEDEGETVLPKSFVLEQNYPNPFNPTTTIHFSLPRKSQVSLVVFNMLGQKVASLLDAELSAGKHTVNWNASKVASGIYFYRLKSGETVLTKKALLLK